MKVSIDTNIIIDVLAKREPHFEASASFINLCRIKITGCIIASQTTDIFYLLQRSGKDAHSAKIILKKLIDNMEVLDITSEDVQNALNTEIPDYEDSLLSCCAKRHNVEYIITRNEKDFIQAPIPALSPKVFLNRFFSA